MTPIISLNDVKCSCRACVRQDEQALQTALADHVVSRAVHGPCLTGPGDGGAYRIRTDDILLAKQALYQLS